MIWNTKGNEKKRVFPKSDRVEIAVINNIRKSGILNDNDTTRSILSSTVIKEIIKGKQVTETARKYRISRASIYRWQKKYDGTVESLYEGSHRPHWHPKQQTEEELYLISKGSSIMFRHEESQPDCESIPWRNIAAHLLGLIEEPWGAPPKTIPCYLVCFADV